MLQKNARLENMFRHGYRPRHAQWIDTYNQQFGGVLSTPSSPESAAATTIMYQ